MRLGGIDAKGYGVGVGVGAEKHKTNTSPTQGARCRKRGGGAVNATSQHQKNEQKMTGMQWKKAQKGGLC